MCKGLWDGAYGLSSLSEKTRRSNRLQMLLQRQHFLLSYVKALSVGLTRVWTYTLPAQQTGAYLIELSRWQWKIGNLGMDYIIFLEDIYFKFRKTELIEIS